MALPPSKAQENGQSSRSIKGRRVSLVVLLLVVVQATSFLVYGFAYLLPSNGEEEASALRGVDWQINGMQAEIDLLRIQAENVELMREQMLEMKRQMEKYFNYTIGDNDVLHNHQNEITRKSTSGSQSIFRQLVGMQSEISELRKDAQSLKFVKQRMQEMRRQMGMLIVEKLLPPPPPDIYNRTMMFLHIGKNGGTSFDPVGSKVASESQYNYYGNRHFDWNEIEYKGQVGKDVEVVLFLRHPVSRAFSHFNFYKKQSFTKGMKIRSQNLKSYLFDGDKQNLLDTRDIWQDGQAAVSWLTGTHIANWVGCPKDQVDARERRALNATAMCYLAAERLQQVKWFGILEDLGRSMELLQHEFNLTDIPKMGHSNGAHASGRANLKAMPIMPHNNKTHNKGNSKATAEEAEALESLMPQDLWLYEYGKRLFEARWEEYKTGVYKPPEHPPIPDSFSCVSTRFELNCTLGPFAGDFTGERR